VSLDGGTVDQHLRGFTNGRVEWMSRTIKDATVKRYHYDSHDQLSWHLDDFVRWGIRPAWASCGKGVAFQADGKRGLR